MNTSDPTIRVLTGLAHDIRTPLHVISLKLTMLERKLAAHLDEEDRCDLASVHAAIDSILALQQSVLDRVRREGAAAVIDATEFALGEVLGRCIDDVRPPAAQKGLSPAQPQGSPAESANHRRVQLINELGLHLRAAQKFVQLAQRFRAEVRVVRDGQRANGKSILELAMLAVERGAHIEIEADGADGAEAISALCDLVNAGFFETGDPEGTEAPGPSIAAS
jgi:phosphocarrier protein HPr